MNAAAQTILLIAALIGTAAKLAPTAAHVAHQHAAQIQHVMSIHTAR